MKKYLLILVIATAMYDSFAQTLDAEQIYKKVNDAVVTVYAYDSEQKILSQGSGVVLNDKGWIVTNYHVYNGADRLIVKHNEKIIEYSQIIGVDADKDILILKIADHTFPYVTIGNSDSLNVGQRIYAIGSPEGFENTMTEGIISGLRSYEAHTQNYVQISAPLSHGSSGGAVVNAKGELIGISTLSLIKGQNLNFAIPVNEVLKVYKKNGVSKNDLSAADFFYKGWEEDESGNYDEAITNYRKSIAIDSTHSETYYSLGVTYTNKRDIDAAILCYKRAIALNPNYAEAYCNLGVAYGEKGDNSSEISYCKKAIAIDPNHANAYYNLGEVSGITGDHKSEVYYYKKAITLNPNHVPAYINLGNAYGSAKDFNTAIYYYKKALAIDSNDVDGNNNLGAAYGDKGDYNTEITYCKKAIAIDPKYAKGYNNLALAYTHNGDYDEAIFYYKKIIALIPDDAEAYTNLGGMYYYKTDYDVAISYYNKAISINPNYANAYHNLGVVYGVKGDDYHSKLNLQKAFKLNPSLRK